MKYLSNSLRLLCITMMVLLICNIASANGKQNLILFPLDNEAGAGNSQVASDITTRITKGIQNDDSYNVLIYNARLASVQRLIKTNPQKNISASGPFARNIKALTDTYLIAEAASADIAFVGSLDRCEINEKNMYDASIAVQLLDVKKRTPIQTIVASGTISIDKGNALDAGLIAANKIIQQITNKEFNIQNEKFDVLPIPLGDIKTIIMTFANQSNENIDIEMKNRQTAILLQKQVTADLIENKIFSIIRYSATTPSLSRAIKENKLKGKDLMAPTDTTKAGASKAQMVGKILGVKNAILGSLDNLNIADEKIELMATIQVISVDTGKISSYITVRGMSEGTVANDEKAMIDKAITDASKKIIAQLIGPAETK